MTASENELRRQLDAISQKVEAARRDIIADRTVDIGELQSEVQAVCGHIQAAPPSDGNAGVVGAVEALIAEFDRLEAELTAQHERRNGGTGR